MPMVMFTTVNGKMIKPMEVANTLIQMELSMKDNGSLISSMVKEKSIGLMVPNTLEIIGTEKKKVMGNFVGLIILLIMEIS
jgi:hypothetical protein